MDSFPAYFPLTGRKVVIAGSGDAADAKARLFEGSPATIIRLDGHEAYLPGSYTGAILAFIASQDEVFVQTRTINKTGVSVIMVEQNAARCLQIADRAYVLDQGRNAYTGTGKALAKDPKVIELYLGTLAKKR